MNTFRCDSIDAADGAWIVGLSCTLEGELTTIRLLFHRESEANAYTIGYLYRVEISAIVPA
jgi:hypothetical protein